MFEHMHHKSSSTTQYTGRIEEMMFKKIFLPTWLWPPSKHRILLYRRIIFQGSNLILQMCTVCWERRASIRNIKYVRTFLYLIWMIYNLHNQEVNVAGLDRIFNECQFHNQIQERIYVDWTLESHLVTHKLKLKACSNAIMEKILNVDGW